MFSKKKFFCPWKHEKNHRHNRSKIIFSSTGPAVQMAQKKKSHTTKSPLMQDLGENPKFPFEIYWILDEEKGM